MHSHLSRFHCNVEISAFLIFFHFPPKVRFLITSDRRVFFSELISPSSSAVAVTFAVVIVVVTDAEGENEGTAVVRTGTIDVFPDA